MYGRSTWADLSLAVQLRCAAADIMHVRARAAGAARARARARLEIAIAIASVERLEDRLLANMMTVRGLIVAVLALEPVAPAAAWRRCHVEDFGAVAEVGVAATRSDDSAAIFAALEACGGEHGGEIVLSGPGFYDAMPMNLSSNQVLHISAGAVLQAPTPSAGECLSASTSCPYPVVQSFPSYTGSRDYGQPCRLGPFIGAYKAKNITITGGGT
eukprot:SAG11_NODE_927_length_6519_cov_2.357788_1_plen_215_part_00